MQVFQNTPQGDPAFFIVKHNVQEKAGIQDGAAARDAILARSSLTTSLTKGGSAIMKNRTVKERPPHRLDGRLAWSGMRESLL